MSRLGRLQLLAGPAMVLAVAALTPEAHLHPDQNDVGLYLDKAHRVVTGEFPYRDFPLEYPPGALIPMVAPYLLGASDNVPLGTYEVLFAAWEALLLLALGVVVAAIGDRLGDRIALRRLILLSIGAILAISWRYDLFPSLLVAVAVWAAIDRRPSLVGFALGLGVLAKLYPLALLPALALPWLRPFDLPRLVRLGATFGLTVLVGLAPFYLVAGDQAFGFMTYQIGRGLQIESVGGGLAVLTGLLGGSPPSLDFGYSAIQVDSEVATALLGILPPLTLVGFAVLAWFGWRRVADEAVEVAPVEVEDAGAEPSGEGVRPTTLVAIAFASVLVLLVTSKVYSIQYVVWILPFLAWLRGRLFWLGVAIVAPTMVIHPMLYSDLIHQDALAILVLNLRNALVVALTAWMLWSLRPSRPIALR